MNDRGSATLLAAAVAAGLVLVAAGLAGVGRMVAAHIQATTAADAAVLAAAPLTFFGGNPTAEAAEFAAANGARLVSCGCEADSSLAARTVTVEVAKEVDVPVFGSFVVRARAAAEFAPLDLLGG